MIMIKTRDLATYHTWGFDYKFTNYDFEQTFMFKQQSLSFPPLWQYVCFKQTSRFAMYEIVGELIVTSLSLYLSIYLSLSLYIYIYTCCGFLFRR